MVDIVEEDGPWVEKFRPANIDDCILPNNLKKKLKSFVKKSKSMPHLLFHGTAGVGKTTAAKALMNEMNADYIVINASKDRNIDTLRTKIQDYASTVSFGDGRKFVILDEADYLNAQSTQPALRNFMEEYAANCGFILTCNHVNRIMDALQSRCTLIHFQVEKSEQNDMIRQAFERFKKILEIENITYDVKSLLLHVKGFYPDLRKALNELQSYSNINNTIDTGILGISNGQDVEQLLEIVKERKFNDMRKWVAEHDTSVDVVIDQFYRKADKHFSPDQVALIILMLAKYDANNALVGNKEINMAAMFTEIMREI